MSAPQKARSVIIRDALRTWLRAYDGYSAAGLDVGRMTRDQLIAQVLTWGGDPNAITAAATDGEVAAQAVSRIDRAAATAATPDKEAPAMPLDATPAPAAIAPADIKAQVEALKTDLVEGGFSAIRGRLEALIDAAAKPPTIITRTIEVPAPERLAPGVHNLKPARTSTWGDVFGIGTNPRPITVWDHPEAPASNTAYVFPRVATEIALSQMARSEAARSKGAPAKHVLLQGPAGTGKSAWAREFASRTGRPFVNISMSDGLEMDQLLGQRVLDGKGGVTWADGLLLAAIRQPGMVVCLDEVGGMRPAVGLAMNGLLQDMCIHLPDTGERVQVARGVVFIGTNNGPLSDGGAAKGFVGVARQNKAFADRFGVSIEIGYAPESVEAGLLVTYTGCAPALAQLLVQVATLSRAKAASDDLTGGIGFRRLLAWAECLTDGIEPDAAFRAAVLNTAPAADVETLRQIALVAIDPQTISAAATGRKLSRAAADFTDAGSN